MQTASPKNGTPRKCMRAAKELTHREGGGALIELAFVMAFLLPAMVFGVLEFGGLAYDYIEVCDAANAGAAYAAQYYIGHSSALPATTAVTTAATNDSPELQTALKSGTTFTAAMYTGCGTGAATAGNTVPTCTSPAQPYVQVKVTATVVPLLTFPLFSSSYTMTDTATMNLVN